MNYSKCHRPLSSVSLKRIRSGPHWNTLFLKCFFSLITFLSLCLSSYAQAGHPKKCKEELFNFHHNGKELNLPYCQEATLFLDLPRQRALVEIFTEAKISFPSLEEILVGFADIDVVKKEWKFAFSKFENDSQIFFIFFDKEEIRNLELSAFKLVLAHELGHLICKHHEALYSTMGEERGFEHDADFMAGYLIARLPSTDTEGLQSVCTEYSTKTLEFLFGKKKKSKTPSYPPQILRKDSFLSGYDYAKKNIIRQRPHRNHIVKLLKQIHHD